MNLYPLPYRAVPPIRRRRYPPLTEYAGIAVIHAIAASMLRLLRLPGPCVLLGVGLGTAASQALTRYAGRHIRPVLREIHRYLDPKPFHITASLVCFCVLSLFSPWLGLGLGFLHGAVCGLRLELLQFRTLTLYG